MAGEDLGEAGEDELVSSIGRGDEAAMAEIVRRHRGAVLAFAKRVAGDNGRAEEITQDVFVRLWERSGRFDSQRGSIRAFLLALTHGRALDVIRSDTARRRREERDGIGGSAAEQEVDGRVLERTVADAVHLALAQIPDAERRAVELAYFGGHSYRTVARLLAEPEGTVKSRIRSGLARLRVALAGQELDSP